MDVIYADDLDVAECDNPDCDHTGKCGPLVLKARCHPSAGLTAKYHEGLVVLACAECGATVVQLVIANKPDPGEAFFNDVDSPPDPG